jgi:hypothetical protein
MPHYLNRDTMAVPEQLRAQSAPNVRELPFKTRRFAGSSPATFECDRHDGGAEYHDCHADPEGLQFIPDVCRE